MDNKKEKPEIREKTIKYGMQYPLDEELIMMIIGSGNRFINVRTLSRKIVTVLDSCNNDDVLEKLLSINGIGEGKALAIASALELGKRRASHYGAHIRNAQNVIPFVKHFAMCKKEHFLAITLNGGNDIIDIHIVSIGTINRTLIHPREVFVEAIKENATAIILVHNHPSGRAEPSNADIETTESLIQASMIIGIPILDHIIIDKEGYYSFLEHDLLFTEGQAV